MDSIQRITHRLDDLQFQLLECAAAGDHHHTTSIEEEIQQLEIDLSRAAQQRVDDIEIPF